MNKEELKRQILQDRERLLASLPEEKRRELEQQEVYPCCVKINCYRTGYDCVINHVTKAS
jgi:hypothetical protein